MDREIDALIQKYKVTIAQLDVAIKGNTDLALHCEKLEQADKVELLQNGVLEYVTQIAEIEMHIGHLEVARAGIAAATTTEKGSEEFLENFNDSIDSDTQKIRAAASSASKKHPKFLEFRQRIWAVNHRGEAFQADDEDIMVVATQDEETIPICPITRSEIDHPMKNTCGHVYSKDAILQLIKQPMRNQCPVAGCNALVSTHTLTADTDLEKRIAKLKQTLKKKPPTKRKVERV